MKILARSIPKEKQKEVKMILEKAAPKEVETLISNLERTLKKAWQDAETKGMQKGMQEGIEKAKKEVAKQMLIDGMDIAMIIKYTGLTREVIEKLGQEH